MGAVELLLQHGAGVDDCFQFHSAVQHFQHLCVYVWAVRSSWSQIRLLEGGDGTAVVLGDRTDYTF